MPDVVLLAFALTCSFCGMGWLALAMDAHWKQVRSGTPGSRTIAALRVLGSAALIVSLLFCLRADHPSMAVLVWVMSLAAAAALTAFVLSWRPRILLLLVAWV